MPSVTVTPPKRLAVMSRRYGAALPRWGEITGPDAFVLVGDVTSAKGHSADGRSFAMVLPMPDNTVDPSGNTEAFRAFTQSTPQEPPAPASKTPLIIGGVAVALVLLALIVWLVA